MRKVYVSLLFVLFVAPQSANANGNRDVAIERGLRSG